MRSISCDGNVYLSGGTLNINNVSAINRFLVSGSTYQAYTSAGIKADGNITVAGNADLNITCNGRCISTDADYTQSGGTVVLSNAGTGFTLVGSGSSCTDGFAPACLKADSSVTITGGSFSGTSTGKGGRGIVTDGRLTVGTLGAADSLVRIYVTTIPTDYRIDCLMQDIPYRLSVATENVGYNQPPETGFYLGPDKKDYLK